MKIYYLDTSALVKPDKLLKSSEKQFFVIPVKTGIQSFQVVTCSLDTPAFAGMTTFYECITIIKVKTGGNV